MCASYRSNVNWRRIEDLISYSSIQVLQVKNLGKVDFINDRQSFDIESREEPTYMEQQEIEV
jgi:hypothetical protein